MSNVKADTNTRQLDDLIISIQSLHDNRHYKPIYNLLKDEALNYQIDSDDNTKKALKALKLGSTPNAKSTMYRGYFSIINNSARATHTLKKFLTHLYNEFNEIEEETDKQLIIRLLEEKAVLMSRVSSLTTSEDIKVSEQLLANIELALTITNLSNVYDIDIFSSMKQKMKETDLIISRTDLFAEFAIGLKKIGLTLPKGSVIYAKGGDGATRFVRLLQGAGDLIKASKELWALNRVTLVVTSLNGDDLRMNVDSEASRIIQEGIKQTLTTLINQGKTKKNSQVITSVLGALLRAGYPLTESINRMYKLLDTEKTPTISKEIVLRAIALMTDGRVNKWHLKRLCPLYSDEELEYEISTLIGVGRGNISKKCKSTVHHPIYLKANEQCIHCDFNKKD